MEFSSHRRILPNTNLPKIKGECNLQEIKCQFGESWVQIYTVNLPGANGSSQAEQEEGSTMLLPFALAAFYDRLAFDFKPY
jgi:hypothetical protein